MLADRAPASCGLQPCPRHAHLSASALSWLKTFLRPTPGQREPHAGTYTRPHLSAATGFSEGEEALRFSDAALTETSLNLTKNKLVAKLTPADQASLQKISARTELQARDVVGASAMRDRHVYV